MVRIFTAVLLATCLAQAAHAQEPAAQKPAPVAAVLLDTPSAHETRDQLHRLLREHPPTVGEVLRLDPSLLLRPDYLAPYPALVAFLAQHPEVARNPAYFLGEFHYVQRDPKERADERAYELISVMLGGMAGLMAFVAVITLLAWIIRSVIDHRRWLRLSRVQTEVHTKLMERLTANEDLLAYIQSQAGRRFLESAPIALDGEPRPTAAPVARILWSLQVGIVLVALGIGFFFVQSTSLPEIADGFYILGVIAMALGFGAVVSAVASYFIANRLGLMSPARTAADG